MSNYPVKRLREVGVTLYDCEHKTPKPVKIGYPYIAIPNIKDGRVDISDVRLISSEDYKFWTRKIKPQKGDIIVTRRGRVGDTAVVPEGLKCAIGQNLVILRSEGIEVDQKFLRWALRGPIYEEQVQKYLNVGAVFYSLNCADIPNFELPIPPLREQQAIAEVLGALDDKIELNRRMNATLEEMARAVFKEWFVDNLEVENWGNGKLGDFIKVNERSITKDFPFREIEYIEISSVSQGHLEDTIYYPINESPSRAKRLVQHGDTIWSTVRPNRKSYLFISDPAENLVVSTGFAVLTPKKIPPSYLYFLATTDQFVDYLISNADGSAYPAVLPNRFTDIEMPVPPMDILEKFENVAGAMLAKIGQNDEESRTLAELRDTLLPKLMKGEVRTADYADYTDYTDGTADYTDYTDGIADGH